MNPTTGGQDHVVVQIIHLKLSLLYKTTKKSLKGWIASYSTTFLM